MSFTEDWKLEIGNSAFGLHHAYLLEGAADMLLEELLRFLKEELSFQTKGNPDFWHGAFDTFGIDEGRALKEMQSRRPVGERKVFIVQANFFTREAQNALLKVFEEPTSDTHFFIITQNTVSLLPTLRSRLFNIAPKPFTGVTIGNGFGERFLGVRYAKRLEMLKGIVEAKDKNAAISFLNDLETTLYQKFGHRTSEWGTSEREADVFAEIQKARAYLNDRAPAVKMLLEHIALTVPLAAA